MNPQTQSRSMDQDPGTPVIVKTGGNGDNGPLVISSPDMPFVPILGATNQGWRKAVSTSEGRVCLLKFKDGDLPEQSCTISSQTELLASLEVHRVADGTELFRVSETSVNGRLQISSGIPFKVGPDVQPDGRWNESETEDQLFLGKDIKIVFKQLDTRTQMSLEYTFSFSEFRVEIYFPPNRN